MKFIYRNLSLSLAATIIMSSSAFASKEGAYVGINTGISILGNIGVNLKTLNYGATIGYKFTDHFRMDFNITNRAYNFDGNSFVNISDIHKDTKGKINISLLNSSLGLYYDITNINGFTPYISLGVGGSYINVKAEIATGEGSARRSETDQGKGILPYGDIGVGCKFDINDKLSFDARYKFTVPLPAHELGVGISYHF